MNTPHALSATRRPIDRFPSVLSSLMACLVIALVLSGCDSHFETVNSNPNEPEAVTPDLLLPGIIRSSTNTSVSTAHNVGNLVVQHVSKVSFATGIDRYDWDGVGFWGANYSALRDAEELIRIAETAENPNYEAVGLIMKSLIFANLTSAYGDVPYFQAFQVLEGVDAPPYDPQEEIFAGLLNDLSRANDLLGAEQPQALTGDILFDGDLDRWQRFANSLQLRLLMRLSEKQGQIAGVNVADRFAEIANSPDQFPVMRSNSDNAALAYLTQQPNQWPPHTSRAGTFRTFRTSTTLTETLQDLDDPRLPVFADPTAASEAEGDVVFAGVPNGLTDDASNEFNGGRDFQSSLNTSRYFDEPNAAEGLLMTVAEVHFLKAEAAARGWIASDPATHYQAGIEASMAQYGQSVPEGYLDRSDVALPASDTEEAIARILSQKWIALFYTGMEGWYNWRRTGIPALEPSASNVNGDRIPLRFRYPESEQSLNGANYEAAVSAQGADNINTTMWLLQ